MGKLGSTEVSGVSWLLHVTAPYLDYLRPKDLLYTLYAFVSQNVLLVLNTKVFSPRLFESLVRPRRLVAFGAAVYRTKPASKVC